MTEQHGPYNLNHDAPDDAGGGIERIGDVLRPLIDERGRRLAEGTRPHGDSPGPEDDSGHGDA